jgi:hypothetical protein
MVARMMIERNFFIVVKEDCLLNSCGVFIWDSPNELNEEENFDLHSKCIILHSDGQDKE